MSENYDPNAPENKYPKMRHQYAGRHKDTGEHQFNELKVKDPDDEKKRTPASKGWVDLKRDVIEAAEAAESKADTKADDAANDSTGAEDSTEAGTEAGAAGGKKSKK